MALSELRDTFRGRILPRGEGMYGVHRYQYAFSSHASDGHMEPAAILYPSSTDDIRAALDYARKVGIAVAVRTGGHHHSGASSTSAPNILLDLRDTYCDFEWDPARNRVRAGISLPLDRFNVELGARGLFLPHGQCSHVRLGGHIQTGGWGMLARSFGLLSDYVESIEMIMADGSARLVDRESTDPGDRDLFFATLGGSPGSFGILTHATFRPLHDADFPDARGLKFLVPYSRETLQALLDIMVEVSSDVGFERDFDYSVTVLGGAQMYLPFAMSRRIDEQMRVHHPEVYGRNEIVALPSVISVYAQWGNTRGAGQRFDHGFFDHIKAAARYGTVSGGRTGVGAAARLWGRVHPRAAIETVQNRVRLGSVPVGVNPELPTRMSELTHGWVFPNAREFNLPYIKRAYLSDSTTLKSTRWAEWVTDRFDALVAPDNGCKGFLQVQHMGGIHSRLREYSLDARTAHSWRTDSTLCGLMDCFYDSDGRHPQSPRQVAVEWQKGNDSEALGQRIFSGQDRRVFFGPWGGLDLHSVWPHYFDSREKFDRLCTIKSTVDPSGVFSAHPFGIRGLIADQGSSGAA